jgi:hypothetical protein
MKLRDPPRFERPQRPDSRLATGEATDPAHARSDGDVRSAVIFFVYLLKSDDNGPINRLSGENGTNSEKIAKVLSKSAVNQNISGTEKNKA